MPNPILSQSRKNANPSFDARFVINAEFGQVTIEPEAEYIARHGAQEAVIYEGLQFVRIDGPHDPIHVTAAEALQLAAAIQAVAIDLMEQEPREIRRRTEAGAPSFEQVL